MATFTWDATLDVGIPEIDAQHREMTDIIATLHEAYRAGREREILAELINRINEYAQMHFATERRYMEPVADAIPNYEKHMQEHREFFSDAIGFLLRYLDNGASITPELLDYLAEWWFRHIRGTDQVMGRVLREKGIV